MRALGWLVGGNDRQLAATKYAGRESATETAARRRREATEKADRKRQARERATRSRDIKRSARAGEAWEEQDRRRFS